MIMELCAGGWGWHSGVHWLKPGSESQAKQQAAFSSDTSHRPRKQDSHDPSALNCVWRGWDGIPC